jgi:glucokinase
VVGPGTGLGEAYLVNVNGAYEPYPCEGGHADLAV